MGFFSRPPAALCGQDARTILRGLIERKKTGRAVLTTPAGEVVLSLAFGRIYTAEDQSGVPLDDVAVLAAIDGATPEIRFDAGATLPKTRSIANAEGLSLSI